MIDPTHKKSAIKSTNFKSQSKDHYPSKAKNKLTQTLSSAKNMKKKLFAKNLIEDFHASEKINPQENKTEVKQSEIKNIKLEEKHFEDDDTPYKHIEKEEIFQSNVENIKQSNSFDQEQSNFELTRIDKNVNVSSTNKYFTDQFKQNYQHENYSNKPNPIDQYHTLLPKSYILAISGLQYMLKAKSEEIQLQGQQLKQAHLSIQIMKNQIQNYQKRCEEFTNKLNQQESQNRYLKKQINLLRSEKEGSKKLQNIKEYQQNQRKQTQKAANIQKQKEKLLIELEIEKQQARQQKVIRQAEIKQLRQFAQISRHQKTKEVEQKTLIEAEKVLKERQILKEKQRLDAMERQIQINKEYVNKLEKDNRTMTFQKNEDVLLGSRKRSSTVREQCFESSKNLLHHKGYPANNSMKKSQSYGEFTQNQVTPYRKRQQYLITTRLVEQCPILEQQGTSKRLLVSQMREVMRHQKQLIALNYQMEYLEKKMALLRKSGSHQNFEDFGRTYGKLKRDIERKQAIIKDLKIRLNHP